MLIKEIKRHATFICLSVILLNSLILTASNPQNGRPAVAKNTPQNKNVPIASVSSKVDVEHNLVQLTKVELKGVNNLEPFADSEDKGYNDTKKSLTGLMVIHTGNERSKMPEGVYMWNGEKWIQAQCDL